MTCGKYNRGNHELKYSLQEARRLNRRGVSLSEKLFLQETASELSLCRTSLEYTFASTITNRDSQRKLDELLCEAQIKSWRLFTKTHLTSSSIEEDHLCREISIMSLLSETNSPKKILLTQLRRVFTLFYIRTKVFKSKLIGTTILLDAMIFLVCLLVSHDDKWGEAIKM